MITVETSTSTETTSPAICRLEAELGTLMRRAREVHRTLAEEVHPDLGPTGYLTLARLVDAGPLRAAELVDYFGLDKGAVSRQLTHLESLGLIRRTPDPEDGRAHVIAATAAGEQRRAAARDRQRLRLRNHISTWDSRYIDDLADLLHEFNASMESAPATPGGLRTR